MKFNLRLIVRCREDRQAGLDRSRVISHTIALGTKIMDVQPVAHNLKRGRDRLQFQEGT